MRFFVLFLLAWPVQGEESSHLTLQRAVEMALRQNPTISKARRALEEADARVKQARADYFPQVGFNGIAKVGLSGATNSLGLIGLPNSPLYRNLADSLNVSQTVFDFGRSKHRVLLQRLYREALEAELASVEAAVALQAERAYYNLLRARKLREAAVEVVRSRELTVRQAQAFYEGRIRSRLDLEQARVGLSRAQLQLLQAENGVRSAVAELGHALGSSQDLEYDVEVPDLTPSAQIPLDPLIQESYQLRPELRSLRAEREAAAENVRLARSQRKPFISMVFSGGYARFTDVLARQLLAGGAGLALPLFTGGKLEGQEEEAEAHLRLMESREEELKQQVALEVRQAYLRVQTAVELIVLLRLQAEYARQAVRLAAERYREQLGSIVELNDAQSSLAQAIAGEAAGAYDVKIAEAELRFAVGRR